MAKVKVKFEKKIVVGGKTFEGEVEVEKPNMGMIIDAGNICPPRNQIGFGAAIIGVTLDIPFNVIREMDPLDFTSIMNAMEPVLPKM